MPRRPRVEFAGAIYHVTTRGARQLPVFCCTADCRRFLSRLAEVVTLNRWTCHAYCLIPNHYHFLVTTAEANLSRGMQRLNWYTARAFNKRHTRSGHAFDSRYSAVLVEREPHLLETCRYIVLNPVRAGLVEHPSEWEWSSYGATCGDVEPADALTTDWVLSQFGPDPVRARHGYRDFVAAGIRD